MPQLGLIKNIDTKPKSALINVFLVANALIWYIVAFRFLQNAAKMINLSEFSLLIVLAFNLIALISSGLFGIKLIYKFKNRLTFLKYWTIAGIIISWVFGIATFSNFSSLLLIGVLTGAYFGIGMPACMGYFASATKPENRAKLAGLIILLMGVFFPILSLIGTNNLLLNSVVLSIWRLLGLILLVGLKPPEQIIHLTEKVSYRSVISNKSFLLYLLPWFMFSLVNDFVMQINGNYFGDTTIFPANFAQNYLIIENIVAGISAVICGFIADKKGRKRIALVGFALLGVGYASLSLIPANYFTAMFFVCASGLGFGSFSMLFIMTIWGDIALEKSSEKYYLIGVLPYLISNFTKFSIGTYIANNVTESTIFSFASFFLFVAILPLIYAPETLPEKIMKSLDLNNYINKALEVAKKETEKGQKELSSKVLEQVAFNPEVVESVEYIEACKLVDKYY